MIKDLSRYEGIEVKKFRITTARPIGSRRSRNQQIGNGNSSCVFKRKESSSTAIEYKPFAQDGLSRRRNLISRFSACGRKGPTMRKRGWPTIAKLRWLVRLCSDSFPLKKTSINHDLPGKWTRIPSSTGRLRHQYPSPKS